MQVARANNQRGGTTSVAAAGFNKGIYTRTYIKRPKRLFTLVNCDYRGLTLNCNYRNNVITTEIFFRFTSTFT